MLQQSNMRINRRQDSAWTHFHKTPLILATYVIHSACEVTFSKMPESWLLSFDLKLDELHGLKSGISAVSLLMSQDTCRLADLELMLERSASVSVQPWRVEAGHKIHPLQSHLPMWRLIIKSIDPSGSHTHRFAVGGWGEPGLDGAGSAKLSGHIRGLACDSGPTCGHKAALERVEVTFGDAQ